MEIGWIAAIVVGGIAGWRARWLAGKAKQKRQRQWQQAKAQAVAILSKPVRSGPER